MTGDAFHLTPVDIRNQEFRVAMRGYDTATVEEFRGRVADELERLLRERAALEERVHNFREQLKAYREREKAMSEALVAAQQLRADAERAAAREAEGIVREARSKADRLLEEAKMQSANIKRDHVGAQRQFTVYLAGFRALLERNLAEVDALEARERDGAGQPNGL